MPAPPLLSDPAMDKHRGYLLVLEGKWLGMDKLHQYLLPSPNSKFQSNPTHFQIQNENSFCMHGQHLPKSDSRGSDASLYFTSPTE
jgi:hypothetical protein